MTVFSHLQVLPEYQAQISQQARTKEPKSAISRIFSRYDVVETSYHFLCQRIDLHLCDDPGGEGQLLRQNEALLLWLFPSSHTAFRTVGIVQ